MTLPTRRGLVPALLIVALMLPATLVADIEGKGGFFDARFDSTRSVGTRFVQWLWWPYFQVGSVPYVIYATCERHSENGQPVGSNKIRFKAVTLRGTDTDTAVTFKKRTVKLKNGEHEIVTWDAGEARAIATETAVIGSAQVQVKGKLAARDFLRCELGVAELTGSDAQVAAR